MLQISPALADNTTGAAIAIMVARLIDEVGLLIDDADDEVYAKLYKLSRKQEWSEADINDVKNGHTCESQVLFSTKRTPF